ncbi:MAG: ATP-binding cassette domain-containing protein [Desulfuromonadales bacterium]
MPLVNLRHISLSFGGLPLFDEISLSISQGERIGLLGRNGTGKSTMLKVIAGELPPDTGQVDRQQGLRVARLEQDLPDDLQGSIYDVTVAGLGETGRLLARYHHLSRRLDAAEDGQSEAVTKVQNQLEKCGGWQHQQHVAQVLSRLHLAADQPVANLSGGLLRRVLLARALACDPDILLLDEPTNHLDIDTITWLEEFLQRQKLTLVFVTHDRTFLRKLADRIIEIDRGRLYDFTCDYDTFLTRKEELLLAEGRQQARFDKKLAEEEAWLRQGVKARRTRNEGRVRVLQNMRAAYQQRRQQIGQVTFNLQEAERSGKLVAEIENLSFGYEDRPLVENFSSLVLRGDRVGIIGPNGVGKTTLLKLILGDLQPQQGRVRRGTNLQITYFDQLRDQLDPERTVQQNLAGDQDTVMVCDRPRHVIGYLQDFLFTPDRARSPVKILSGGERNRLLLARLFIRQTNVLVLDEPTNDLDLETLDLLEELLADFKGTLFLVSHDRDFLNRVVTSTIAFEGPGVVREYVGGYDDWLRQRPQPEGPISQANTSAKAKPRPQRSRKLSFKEKRELDQLPVQIEGLESEMAALHEKLADADFYRTSGDQVATVNARIRQLQAELTASYQRWEELDALPDSGC